MRPYAATFLLLLTSAVAHAQTTREITPFVAYQAGGSVSVDGRDADLNAGPAFGLFITFGRGRGRKLDVVLSHQSTRAERSSMFDPPVSADATVDSAQIGGRYVFTPEERVAPYVAMTVGGTRLALRRGSALAFAYAIGGGADLRLGARTALRLDGRFNETSTAAHAEFNCADGGSLACSGFGSGPLMSQFTASVGVVVKY